MNAQMLARVAHEAARAAHYDGPDMLSWENESDATRTGAVQIAQCVLDGRLTREELSEVFPDGDCVGQRVLLGIFLAALPIQPEPESPETDEQRAERLALEKRNRIVSPRVTEREKPGECITLSA